MIVEVEMDDDKALKLLKQLEDLNVLRVLPTNIQKQAEANGNGNAEIKKASVADLYGAIPFVEKKYKEQMQFLHEIRNEWE